MNASDIVKAKQNKALYKASNLTLSSISTITLLSSFRNGDATYNNSYGSTIKKCYTYDCPNFISYEMAQNMKDGKDICTGKVSKLEWKNNTSTFIYTYSSIDTTNPTGAVTNNIYIESTIIMSCPAPIICPLIQFHQGTSYN